MKVRTILASLGVLAVATLCLALPDTNANLGIWKLNEGKSKFTAGATKNTTVVYTTAADGMMTVTVDGVDKDGKQVHNVWTGRFDGKDYPVMGDALIDSRSYTKVDANTMDMMLKSKGKLVGTGRISVSNDGKSRTVTTKGADAAMTSLNNTAVYDKQ